LSQGFRSTEAWRVVFGALALAGAIAVAGTADGAPKPARAPLITDPDWIERPTGEQID
jgi:hypothetical protein